MVAPGFTSQGNEGFVSSIMGRAAIPTVEQTIGITRFSTTPTGTTPCYCNFENLLAHPLFYLPA